METRLTLRPGQAGTRKLLERHGERLVCVRYLYDRAAGRRLKTVELVVEAVPWKPNPRRLRRRDDDVVAVRIAWGEADLRERAKRLGAIWRPGPKIWEMRWADARRLGIADRVKESSRAAPAYLPLDICRQMAVSTNGWLRMPVYSSTIPRTLTNSS